VTRLLVGTTNAGKLREIRHVLASAGVTLLGLVDLPPMDEPAETGDTFAANARLKARYYAARAGLPTVAEDSGLVVDAMDGEPGVRSARFLRPDASYPERFAEIHRRLAGHPAPHTARFVCAVAVARGDQILWEGAGRIEGEIAATAEGDGGFGYDPIFRYPPFGRTLARVSREDKLAVAHRGHAFRALAAWLRQGGLGGRG
jgi:XTP/dITP diphosphohydrolase